MTELRILYLALDGAKMESNRKLQSHIGQMDTPWKAQDVEASQEEVQQLRNMIIKIENERRKKR